MKDITVNAELREKKVPGTKIFMPFYSPPVLQSHNRSQPFEQAGKILETAGKTTIDIQDKIEIRNKRMTPRP